MAASVYVNTASTAVGLPQLKRLKCFNTSLVGFRSMPVVLDLFWVTDPRATGPFSHGPQWKLALQREIDKQIRRVWLFYHNTCTCIFSILHRHTHCSNITFQTAPLEIKCGQLILSCKAEYNQAMISSGKWKLSFSLMDWQKMENLTFTC